MSEPNQSIEPPGQGAGRGLLFITFAKLWFMVAGYVIQFGLPRALGSAEKFGVWIALTTWLSPLNNVMITTTIQSVAKFSSERGGRTPAVIRAALKLHVLVGGSVALAFFLGAPLIARFVRDAEMVPYLRLAAGVVLCYAFYAIFVGAANGTRQFLKQAALDASFSTMRATLVVGAAVVFGSALASVGGFVIAAAVILVASVVVVGVGRRPDEPFPVAKLARFFAGVATYLLIVNLLMFVDSILLKPLVSQAAAARGAADPTAIANTQEGLYGAAQNIARLPYQLILAVTFVIFPLMSKATFEKDADRARLYVAATMRYSFVVVALMAVALGSRPEAVMRLFYKPEFAVAATAVVPLLGGYVCFSLFTIAGTIINSAGRTRPTTMIGLAALLLAAGANWAAVRYALATGHDPLRYAALSTAAAMAAGLAISGAYLLRTFGAFLSLVTLGRVALAAGAAVAVGRLWPTTGFLGGKVGTLASMAACGLAFLTVAVASGELRPKEILALRKAGKG